MLPKHWSESNHNNYKLVNFFPGTLNAKIVTNQKPEIDFQISIHAKKCASNRQVKISLMPFVPTDFSFTILQKETAFLYLESIIQQEYCHLLIISLKIADFKTAFKSRRLQNKFFRGI